MESRAVHRFIGSSPRKMRLIIDLIRGMSVDKAIEVLHFSTKHASKDAEKVLEEARSKTDTFVKSGKEKVDLKSNQVKTAIKAGVDAYKETKNK